MFKSLIANKKGIGLMIASSLLVCIGQLCWKLSVYDDLLLLIIGFALYGIGALIMLKAYNYGKLSVLQPMLSMNYVFTLFLGYYVLGEIINTQKIIAIILIMLGVLLIGGSDNE